jgi:kynureninase
MERLADFIKTNHGSQDWENGVYNLQDYLAAFIGAREKEVYQDLIERMKGK